MNRRDNIRVYFSPNHFREIKCVVCEFISLLLISSLLVHVISTYTNIDHGSSNTKEDGKAQMYNDMVRTGEKFVSDSEAIDCVHRLLQSGKEVWMENEYSTTTREVIPLLIIPVTVDYVDFKTLMCNLTIPIHYCMIIHNGEHDKLAHLLTLMSTSLLPKHNAELFIVHHPENMGYAAAVNEGLRFALTHSIVEVPWVYVTNSDVRFHPSRLQSLSRIIAERTHNDAEVIQDLLKEREEEIKELLELIIEEENYTIGVNVTKSFMNEVETKRNYMLQLLQHGSVTINVNNLESGSTVEEQSNIKKLNHQNVNVTIAMSSLLPRRIRIMGAKDMSSAFRHHTGLFFANSRFEMSSFAISRLHLETVGLLDENFYPAYGEDFDYKWRSAALGFSYYVSPAHEFVHYENANLQVGNTPNPLLLPRCTEYYHSSGNHQSYKKKKYKKQCGQLIKFKRMNYQPIRLHYRRSKWFPFSSRLIVDTNRSALPFAGALPIDVWVKDNQRINSIWEVGEGLRCRCDVVPYNTSLLSLLTSLYVLFQKK